MRKPLSPITLTDAAAERVKALLARHTGAAAGLRIGVKSKGCSGLSYNIEYADAKGPHDEVVETRASIFIDPQGDDVHPRQRGRLRGDKLQSGLRPAIRRTRRAAGCGEIVPRPGDRQGPSSLNDLRFRVPPEQPCRNSLFSLF